MSLLDLIRPQWKHSDPAKRMEAVRLLEADRRDVFISVALDDADPAVRLAAARRLDAEADLRIVLQRSQDAAVLEVVRLALAKRIAEWALAAQDADVDKASAWVAELQALKAPERIFADLAQRAAALDVRKAAFGGLVHASSYLDVALKESDDMLAEEALSRLEKETHLESVARNAKSAAARAVAKQRLKALADARKPDSAAIDRARLHIVVSAVEKALAGAAEPGHGFDWNAAREQVDAAAQAFAELAATGMALADGLRAEFERNVAGFRAREAAHRAAEEERRAREAEEARIAAIRHDACERMEILFADPRPVDADAVAELESRYRDAGPAEADEALAGRFRIARERLRDRLRRQREGDAEQQRKDAADAARKSAEAGNARAAGAARDDARARREATEILERETAELQRLAASPDDITRNLKAADQRLREARELARQHAARVEHATLAAFHTAADALNELLEWNRWANLRRKGELCDQLEALATAAEAAGADLRPLAGRFQELENEWKRTGPVPWKERDALQARHEKVAAALQARFEGHFAELEEARAANLRAKEELCASLEALLAAPEPDWRALTERFREAHASWKEIGPVPRDQADALWERFRAANRAFTKRRDADLNANLAARRALVEQAEALRESTAWKQTAEELQKLQQQWKELGPAPREKTDALWKRFRAACDAFFEARKANFAARDAEQNANLARKLELCAAAEALRDAPDDDARAARAGELQQQWKETGHVPRAREEELRTRFRNALDALQKRVAPASQHDAGIGIREDICMEAERLAGMDRQEAAEKVKALQAKWKTAPPIPRYQEQLLWARFRMACDRFFAN